MTFEEIARIAHYANKAYCETLGDWSQDEWFDLTNESQGSITNGVHFVSLYPQATPEALHDSWLASKAEGGWTYGKEKNDTLKTHPCFVPFDELPGDQQVKDGLFKAIVTALL